MKLRHRYLNPIIVFLIVYMFGLLLYHVSNTVVSGIYTYLNYLLPESFPAYSLLAEKEANAELQKKLSVWGLLLTLFLINFIALKLENKKYERIVIQTDGLYLIKDGIKLYFKEFFKSDLITSALVPALLVIPPYFIPEKAMGYFGLIIPTWLGYYLKPHYNIAVAMIMVAAFSYAGRLISIPFAVKSWRAAWLSDI